MKPAASATTAADRPNPRRRRARDGVTRRAGLQLLAGVLIVGAIPVVSTVRILDANAVSNERARTDAALRAQLQSAVRELGRLGDDASTRADDLARSPVVQRALIGGKLAPIEELALREPGVLFYREGRRIAGIRPARAIERSVWLTVDGRRIGKLVATVALDQKLAARLARDAPHGAGYRLLLVRRGVVLGTGRRAVRDGRSLRLGGERYRALLTGVPDTAGIQLLALRPEKAIAESVEPYRKRVFYAAIGSFALLVLVAVFFAGPILRTLGDFRRVASQATTDALTGIANRRSFDEELALEWRRAKRIDTPLALILADLDNFKSINDRFGHQAGDVVLSRFGEILGAGVRQIDLAARYGGEEFAVLAPETELKHAVLLAERLRTELAKAPVELPDGHELEVTASFGVAVSETLVRAEELVAAADQALYEAKRAGKNRVATLETISTEAEPAAPAERRRRPPVRTAPKASAKAAAKPAAKKPAKPAAKQPVKAAAKAPAKKRKAAGTSPA